MRFPRRALRGVFAALLAVLAGPGRAPACPPQDRPFRIAVVDSETGRGVPLVTLETVHHVRWVTDSAGLAAVDAPELFGRRVWFGVESDGYAVPRDGFGNAGFACTVLPGGSHTVEVDRTQVAERLYRVTGAGIYRDAVLLGEPVPLADPLCAGGVLGSDSVCNALYRGELWWFWGDTNRAAYPLGNFAVTGARSRLQEDGGLSPEVGVDLDYFIGPDGFARPLCPLEGPGPVWIYGPLVVREDGAERLLAHFARMRDLGSRHEHGIALWSDEAQRFEPVVRFPLETQLVPSGNPVRVHDADGEWFVFTNPYPAVRVPARYDAIVDPSAYQSFARDADGWSWRAGIEPLAPADADALPEGDRWMDLRDVATGDAVRGHGGTVCWNAHRGRWIMIALQAFGRSALGEVWFAEADTLAGPWVWARRIVTHRRTSFYNVKQHPYFDAEGGRRIYFEGTYTMAFSGYDEPVPRYNYNQVLYAMDLDDPRLALPRPVYHVRADGTEAWLLAEEVSARDLWGAVVDVPFYALTPGGRALDLPGETFAVVPPDEGAAPLVALSEWRAPDGRRALLAGGERPAGDGWDAPRELGRVWPAPSRNPPRTPSVAPVPLR